MTAVWFSSSKGKQGIYYADLVTVYTGWPWIRAPPFKIIRVLKSFFFITGTWIASWKTRLSSWTETIRSIYQRLHTYLRIEVRFANEEDLLGFYLCCLSCREILVQRCNTVETNPTPNWGPDLAIVLCRANSTPENHDAEMFFFFGRQDVSTPKSLCAKKS